MASNATHVLRIALQDQPTTYREIEVPSSASLYDLAEFIVSAFGFDFDHAFGFYADLGEGFLRSQPRYELFADMGEGYDSFGVRTTRVWDAFPEVGQTLLFLFDYGDEWRFTVEVIERGGRQPNVRYPRTLKSVGAAPEQYGAWDEEDDNEEGDADGRVGPQPG